ncbi:zinc finger protein 20-like [Lutzomyia longipalpis]|uniref:zinc finger protein 20-like n=1 Tax=Lutzomyia longipalpis TaxID=7200 RepID=UPI002483C9F7|nr:zinc finger protein 20-like [Lutzomyia longipalpis]
MARDLREEATSQEIPSDDEDLKQIWSEYQADTQSECKNESFRLDCCYCAERFPSSKQRFRHEKTCVIGPVERFSCKLCCINFRYEQGLWRHDLRHQLPGGFLCHICNAGFTSHTDRVQHMDAQHREYKCQICVGSFRKKVDYVNHIVRTHSNCKCWILQKSVKEEEAIKDSTQLTCDKCGSCMGSLAAKLEQLAGENEVSIIHPMETIHIEEYPAKQDKIPTDVELFNGIADEPQKSKPIRRSPKRRKRPSPEKILITSDEEFPDLDDDLPLSRLKKQATTTEHYTVEEVIEPPERRRNKRKRISIESGNSDGSNEVAFQDVSESNDSLKNWVKAAGGRRRRSSTNDEQKICKIPEYRCKLCPQIYCFEKRYLGHLKTEHGIEMKPESENENDSQYNLKETFLLGYRKHGCRFCKRRFATKEALTNHERCHTPDGKLRIKCTLCSELFEDEQQIKEHKKSVHRDEVTCKFCNKTYAGERNLQTHIDLRHTKTKTIKKMTYLCRKCGKNFTSKTALLDHERSDCGKAPIYQCDVCKKFYHSAGSLKGHKTLHTKVRPFLCKFCGKSYRNPGQLRVHERTHTGEKPHKCTYCPKAFSHRETLLTHITMHTGFKRFMCSGCGKRFACISNLQVHRKAHADTCGLVPNCTKAVGPMDIHLMPQEDNQM